MRTLDETAALPGRRPPPRRAEQSAAGPPAVTALLHLQRSAGNRAVGHLLPHRPIRVQRVLVQSTTDPSVWTCSVTGITARHQAGGLYQSLTDQKMYRYDGTKLMPDTGVAPGTPFGAAPKQDGKPPPGTVVVDSESEDEEQEQEQEQEDPTPTTSAPATPVGGPRSPWSSPGGTTRARSPGGSTYRQRSPSGQNKSKRRRLATGYKNPDHGHGNMLAHWEAAAVSPIPDEVAKNPKKRKAYFMDPKRRYRGTSPGRSRTQEFQGHSGGVLGHQPSASTHWNNAGHTQPRPANQEHNRSTGAYHGIELRQWSDESGAGEPRFMSPGPHLGSHPSYWKRGHPGFQGGPWHSWEKDPGTT